MTELSPAAQAVMTAYLTAPMHNDHRIADMLGVAAALRAAALQMEFVQDHLKLLAIAAELEGLND
jgi:hypothetical protein